jgi:two-component system, NarL family, response regulator LiaR
MSKNKTRVLIADDHPLMRDALTALIEDEADLELAGTATDGIQAVRQAIALAPDIVVLDLMMPGKSGLEAIDEICASDPDAHILVLTSSTDDAMVLSAIHAGALGYLIKDAQPPEVLAAIRQVGSGNSYLPPPIALKLAQSVRRERDAAPVEPLTEREREVLKLIGQGSSNKETAETLVLTEGTVRTHVHNILGKLGLKHRTQAVLYAVREGLVKA